MTVEAGIERLAALVLLLTSVSHIVAPEAWQELFSRVRRPAVAGFVNAAVHLPLGLLIAAFHDVWTWPGVVVTVIGWALVLKGALQLMFPQWSQRTLALPGEGASGGRRYRMAGPAMLPCVGMLGWIALR